ncbi:hypothetical protein [Streptomyces sp. NPDC012825]|uniref:hypothetical protein n=1 Tax=Streptomyces sp. NPDC012825 TaxID=3364851 RepID=UPI0036A01F73
MSSIPRPRSNADEHRPNAASPAASGPDRARGWLRARFYDIDMGATYGWAMMAGWLRIASVVGVVLVVLGIVYGIGSAALDAGHALPWKIPADRDPNGLLATIDQPIRDYLGTHTAGLPVTATVAYGTWQVLGVLSLAGGWCHISGARLTWVLWVAATVAMVWSATPGPGRPVAAGITVLAGAVFSVIALNGLSLTPTVLVDIHTPTPPAPQVHAEIHLPKPEPKTPLYKPFDPQKPGLN